MAKPKGIVEPMCQNNQQQGCLEELKKSPLFYLSAGSKELFHSDFLYWLAISHWEVFIRVMRMLAGSSVGEQFWWEAIYSLKAENLEVKREAENFDLAVYVRPHKNWVPVLVLENKVKRLPGAKQLKDYSDKAEKEWADKKENREEEQNITFILLSLTDADSQQNDPTLTRSWIFTKYNDLPNALKINTEIVTGFHKQLYENYCSFIRALSELAESWTVKPNDLYLVRLCPFALCAKDKKRYENAYNEFLDLVDVRLADIWQKVSFDKLRIQLETQLSSAGINCNRFCKDKNGSKLGFYLDSNYTTSGLVELRYVLENHPYENDPVCVMIQLQNNQYRYAVTADKIVADDIISPNRNSLNDKVNEETTNKIIEWVTSKPMSGKKDWCHFGSSFIHRYKQIESSQTVKSIIDAIVKDTKEILELFGK